MNPASPRLTRQALADDLLYWSAAIGTPCEHRLAERLAGVIIAIVPDADAGRQSLLARYSLWTVLLDDRLDEPGADPAALRALTEQLAGVARTGAPPDGAGAGAQTEPPIQPPPGSPAELPAAPLAESAAESLAELPAGSLAELPAETPAGSQTASPAASLAESLAESLVGALADLLGAFRHYGDPGRLAEALCDAMCAAVEQATRDPGTLPTVEDYLAVASRDINYRSFAHALVLLVGGTRSTAALRAIDAALVPASRAVRLANDLRTVDRDLAAGRLNVLSLRHPGGGAVRVATVVRQIADEVRSHDALLGAVADPAVAAALRNSLHVAIGLYRTGDLR